MLAGGDVAVSMVPVAMGDARDKEEASWENEVLQVVLRRNQNQKRKPARTEEVSTSSPSARRNEAVSPNARDHTTSR